MPPEQERVLLKRRLGDYTEAESRSEMSPTARFDIMPTTA